MITDHPCCSSTNYPQHSYRLLKLLSSNCVEHTKPLVANVDSRVQVAVKYCAAMWTNPVGLPQLHIRVDGSAVPAGLCGWEPLVNDDIDAFRDLNRG